MKDQFPKHIALAFGVMLGLLGIGLIYTAVKPLFSDRFGIASKLLLILLSLIGICIVATAFYVASWGF